MKKIFTLFAAVAFGLTAFAQDAEVCPSTISFAPMAEEQDANKVVVELQLQNASQNLNGFNMEVGKFAVPAEGVNEDFSNLTPDESMQWAKDEEDDEWVGFSGYGHVILAMWEGATDNQREQKLFQKCDCNCSVKNGKLVIIEVLKTLEPRFFPVLETPTGIARFTVDMSGCADGVYALYTVALPTDLSFSFTGGPEGNRAWTPDAPIYLELKKEGDKVTPTAISTVAVDQAPADNRIFDLQGRELNRIPDSGIYIQNGKKYVK